MSDSKGSVNAATVNLLSSLLEIFATVRSVLATYAVSMAVTHGDQTFSIFTVAVIEGALLLSMFSIGFEIVSPITAIMALAFSAVMQWVELSTLTGSLDADMQRNLMMALAFAPTVLLALGILRRLKSGGDVGSIFERLLGMFNPVPRGKGESKSYAFDVPRGKGWVETRKTWRDALGKKHSKVLPRGKRRSKRKS